MWSIQQKRDLLLTGSHDNIVSVITSHMISDTLNNLQAILWNARHCRYLRRLKGHTGAVFGVDMDDSAHFAFTASGDKVCYQSGPRVL